MSRYTVEAVVLKFTNFKDSDKIYTLFTKEKGKIIATGKGVRKISSRRGGNLDTLNHVIVTLSENAGGYKSITEVKTLNSFKKLKGSLGNSVRGFYITELVYKLLEEDQEQNEIFDLLVRSLEKLEENLDNEVSRVNSFEIKLMDLLGYGMYLDRCARTGRKYDGTWEVIKFNPAIGGFVSEPNVPGLVLSKETADLLYALKTKRNINKGLLSNGGAVKEANTIIKSYVRDVLDGNVRVSQMFGEF
ncbi:DNA repair protein RecO [candidate division WWE3 bacterium RIFCSPHIGHO2_01_FULL_42_13]|uniref:DNA repair protein RecO n=1 Tax=candidate division WWE3 bacterium RIFCSPHIGHO2_01_FULL_42_13 TaxID=1802617 RepID=A0A1F4UQT5_UNCKA|nr:MAG: DNA repair protein RecO [candidate division WWE3 bacterium RIFCSPHIGHO2_01_FULL_42_13]